VLKDLYLIIYTTTAPDLVVSVKIIEKCILKIFVPSL